MKSMEGRSASGNMICVALFLFLSIFNRCQAAFGSLGDKVRLTDVNTLTLYSGQMTRAHRSAPVPQLKCIGGSANCRFVPQVVQCQNKGSDGYDVQWECKTDMDNAYRFGRVEVTCEGYDYPDDPYILRGSCGLEYTIDLTKEGYAQSHSGGSHNYYTDSDYHNRDNSYYSSYSQKGRGLGFKDFLPFILVAIVVYVIYKKCLSQANEDRTGVPQGPPPPYSTRDTSPPPHGSGYSQPPPPGFRPEFTSGNDSCGSTRSEGYGTSTGTDSGTGSFWNGAATGGLLGYLLGRNTYGTGYYNDYYSQYQAPYRRSWFGGWGSGGGSYAYQRPATTSFSSGGFSSSGTRTASGFGGTKRR